MAYMSQPTEVTPAGENFIRVLVRGLGTNQISSLTIHCSNGYSYNASVAGGSTNNYYSTTQTFTGLEAGRGYSFWATGRTSGGTAINVSSETFYTTRPSNIYPDAPSVSVNVNGQSVTVTVTARYGTQRISSSLGNNSKDAYIGNGETTYFYYTVSEWNTSYDLYVYAYSSTGHSNYTYRSVSIGSPPAIYPTIPSVSTTVNGKRITVTITARANTAKVWCVLGGNTNKTETFLSNGQTTHYYFDVSSFNTPYSYTVYAYSTTGHSTTTSGTVRSGADNIPPTISLVSTDRFNALTVNWIASDDTGLRASNTFALSITGANGSSYHDKGYLGINARSHTFGTDGNGNAFVVGSTYRIRITVYDSSNNSATLNVSLIFAKTKPTSFSWTHSKTSGGTFLLTASEWNSLLIKVDDFRAYKGLVVRSPTRVTQGQDVLASHFNTVRNMIYDMNNSTPSTKVPNDTIYASDLNSLVSSLNNIS